MFSAHRARGRRLRSLPLSGTRVFGERLIMSVNLANLFFAAASCHPEREALVLSDASLSYQQLDTCVRRLRSQLDPNRDGPYCGVFAHRSTTAFAGVLGVLAAGCAYVPLSP